jgi:ubiquinone/menaquinone biosynthesis C-methylase UbiE
MKKLSLFLLTLLIYATNSLFCAAQAQNSYRDSWQQPEKIMDAVRIKEGMIIGEAGAGEGYFTFYLSKRVGKSGKVYANDIKKNVLEKVIERCQKDSIENISTILGEVSDPLFPKGELDMVIMMRAFHDFTKPIEWMKNVIPTMKTNAPLVIIDLDPEKADRGWDHFLTKQEILTIMEKTDFELDRIETFLERDNIYIYKLKESDK